ncbi:hypothetical protein OIDMADRAFT_57549 [Oidiodendron maius Zn]|uniref:Uncharacterized protein n=1 Tax=Oidiodendron maius (strain Zn) TaxID=913774 RepID=A0A0C3D821_OIDMZ|nr:hypothetical protein OIDMADRAFT_57549 [Oidiodendron maius Zn]
MKTTMPCPPDQSCIEHIGSTVRITYFLLYADELQDWLHSFGNDRRRHSSQAKGVQMPPLGTSIGKTIRAWQEDHADILIAKQPYPAEQGGRAKALFQADRWSGTGTVDIVKRRGADSFQGFKEEQAYAAS